MVDDVRDEDYDEGDVMVECLSMLVCLVWLFKQCAPGSLSPPEEANYTNEYNRQQ